MTKRPPSVKLSEADVTKQVTDFLRYRKWTLIRLNSGLFNTKDGKRTYQIGEKGQADWLALKPLPMLGEILGVVNVIFIEMKATGKKPNAEQERWLWVKREEGFRATWVDSLDSFIEWYESSGVKAT